MALRHRQEGGVPLTEKEGVLWTATGCLAIPFLARIFWFPLLESFGVTFPNEIKTVLMLFGILMHISHSAWKVQPGKERAQLFMGRYTGLSFPAGICFLPALPLPLVSLVLKYVLSYDINAHLGWTLEGDVHLESITIETKAEGLTTDGIRVSIVTTLIFEIVRASTFLSQTRQDTDRSGFIRALASQASARIKQVAIGKLTAEQLYRASYSNLGPSLNELISSLCHFEEEFGVVLAQSPITEVKILNERIQEAFDSDQAKDLLRRNTNEYALAFAEFKKNLPSNVSDDIALAFFNTARMNSGQPPVTMNMVKVS
jgi:hypothetical protein